MACHAVRGGVEDGVKAGGGGLFAGEGGGSGVGGEDLGAAHGTVEDGDGCACGTEGEDGGAGGAACSEDEDGRVLEGDALREGSGDAGGVGVVALKTGGGAEKGVGGSDVRGDGCESGSIGRILQVGEDLFLEWHGDAGAGKWKGGDGAEEFRGAGGLEREVDGIGDAGGEGGVEHGGGLRGGDGVAEDAVDASAV